jgi:hypothetical protein
MKDGLAYLGDLSGAAYAWLGHFRAEYILECGHNTDDAEAMDEMIQSYSSGRAPGSKAADEPLGA